MTTNIRHGGPHAASGRHAGRVAIVTGASRGIGLAIAQRLVAEGAQVCLTARKQEALNVAAAEFPAGSVLAIAGRSDDAAHRAEVFDSVAEHFGHLDVLVNNAGTNTHFGSLLDIELDAARKMLEVNVLSNLAWVQDACKHPRLDFVRVGNSIINMSSVTGNVPSHGIGFYGVSKAALSHLTKTLASELGPQIRVNAIAPAVVKTRFSTALYEGKEEEVVSAYPLKRLGVPEDIAAAVSFLASDDAAWVSGQVLGLDGGLLAAGGTA